MNRLLLAALAAAVLPGMALAQVKHFPAGAPGAPPPAFSGSVLVGKTLYVSGTTDNDRATGKPPPVVKDGAKLVLNNIKATVEAAGYSMDDLVWVQVFASDQWPSRVLRRSNCAA